MILSIPHIFTNILENVETINDLIKLCNVSSDTKIYCQKYTSQYFFKLLQKDSFRESYYTKLSHAIDISNDRDMKLLTSFYPIGKFYGKNYDLLNRLQKFCHDIGVTITYKGYTDQTLNKIWKILFKCIFLPPSYLINDSDIQNLKNLSELHFFNLGFHRELYYPIGLWDIETFFELYDLLQFLNTGKLTGWKLDLYKYEKDFSMDDTSEETLSGYEYIFNNKNEYKEYFSILIQYLIECLNMYKTYDTDLFHNIIKIYIKKLSYFIVTNNDDDIDDFIPYGDISLQILYKIEDLDKQFVINVITSCFNDLHGMDLNKYDDYRENDNYIYLESFLQHFNTYQTGGRRMLKRARSKCKSNKISTIMKEFKSQTLKTRWGDRVTNPKQAIAIALSMSDKYCKK